MTLDTSDDSTPSVRKSSALQTAWAKALGGGIPGVAAQAAQVRDRPIRAQHLMTNDPCSL